MVVLLITLTFVICALCAQLVYTTYSRTGKLIGKIPGPPRAPIVGNVWDLSLPPDELWNILRKWGDSYYSIYKFWLGHWPVINMRHPDDLEVVLGTHRNMNKSLFYDYLHPWLETGLLTSGGSKWHTRRKMLTPAFHYRILQEFVGVFVENAERMVEDLKAMGGEVVVDADHFTSTYTLNNVCETAMGTSLESGDPEQRKYRAAVKEIGEIVYWRSVRPWYRNEWIFSWTENGRLQAKLLKILHGFTDKIIKERKKYHEETGGKYLIDIAEENEPAAASDFSTPTSKKKKRLAMLDLLIAEQKKNNDIDDRGIREEVDTFVFEGHDTTEMALCFTLLLLGEHKKAQERVRQEFGELMKQCNGRLGVTELQSLNYLDRCVKEAIRLYPSVPLVSRLVSEDTKLKNYTVPRGSTINIHIIDVHRDPNFWPDPLVFDPDRFLPERFDGRHPYSYVPFSAGPRNCIGQKFAMLELKALVGMMLLHFHVHPMKLASEIQLCTNLVLKSSEPLNIRLTPIA